MNRTTGSGLCIISSKIAWLNAEKQEAYYQPLILTRTAFTIRKYAAKTEKRGVYYRRNNVEMYNLIDFTVIDDVISRMPSFGSGNPKKAKINNKWNSICLLYFLMTDVINVIFQFLTNNGCKSKNYVWYCTILNGSVEWRWISIWKFQIWMLPEALNVCS